MHIILVQILGFCNIQEVLLLYTVYSHFTLFSEKFYLMHFSPHLLLLHTWYLCPFFFNSDSILLQSAVIWFAVKMQFIKSTFGKFQQMHLFKHPGQLGCQLFVYKFNLLQYQFFTAVEFKFIFSWEMKCSFFFKIWELLAFSPSLKFTKIKLELFSIYLCIPILHSLM